MAEMIYFFIRKYVGKYINKNDTYYMSFLFLCGKNCSELKKT